MGGEVVGWFALSIGTQRVLPLPDGEHLLRPPGATKDRMRLVVDGDACELSESSESSHVQELAPSGDGAWVSHLIATPESVLMIVRGEPGVDVNDQADAALSWLQTTMDDTDSVFIGWRSGAPGTPLEACSIERDLANDILAGAEDSVHVVADEVAGWCRIKGLLDDEIRLLMVNPHSFPGASMRFDVAMSTSATSGFTASAVTSEATPLNDFLGELDLAIAGHRDRDVSELGTWGVAVSRVPSGSSSTMFWPIDEEPLLVTGPWSDQLTTLAVCQLIGERGADAMHVHLLSDQPALIGLESIAHAGAWCADGSVVSARRALAVIETDLRRRQTAMSRNGILDASKSEQMAPIQVVVIRNLDSWLRVFDERHDRDSGARLWQLLREGPRAGYAIVLSEVNEAMANELLSSHGFERVVALRCDVGGDPPTDEAVAAATASAQRAGLMHPGTRRPYRLEELPRSVPFVALSVAKTGRAALELPIGLNTRRQVCSMSSYGDHRVSYLIGPSDGARANLIGVIIAGVEKGGMVAHRAVSQFNLVADVPGSIAVAIVEADRVPADELEIVLAWGQRKSQHHVIVLASELWWDAHGPESADSYMARFDGTLGQVTDGEGFLEFRIADAPKERI